MLMVYLRICKSNYNAKSRETSGAKPESEPGLDKGHPAFIVANFFLKKRE
jgi:hypothetical protein